MSHDGNDNHNDDEKHFTFSETPKLRYPDGFDCSCHKSPMKFIKGSLLEGVANTSPLWERYPLLPFILIKPNRVKDIQFQV